mmetsp:Transcript_9263/g.20187  ORF Transcript_9263/g.20187 Transcript_9263/m.20187 type:complete len:532 (-) Transcript_9263:32-1627(-)
MLRKAQSASVAFATGEVVDQKKRQSLANRARKLSNVALNRERARLNRGPVQHWVDGFAFSSLVGLVIVVNSAMAPWAIAAEPGDPNWQVADSIFAVVYVFEFVARVYYHRFKYWKQAFNIFDTFLVVVACLEAWVLTSGSLTFLLVLRMLRFLRLLRLLTLFPFFAELTSILSACGKLWRLMGWVIVILFALTWTQGIFFSVIIGSSDRWMLIRPDSLIPFHFFRNKEYFGGVSKSCFTLFQFITVDGWADAVVRPMTDKYPETMLQFICFTMLGRYGILNLLLASVVSQSIESVWATKRALAEAQASHYARIKDQLWDFFQRADLDGSGSIDLQELQRALGQKSCKQLFAELELPISQIEELFTLLDRDNSGEVSRREFIDGCIAMKDVTVDIDKLYKSTSMKIVAVQARARYAVRRAERLQKAMDNLLSYQAMMASHLDYHKAMMRTNALDPSVAPSSVSTPSTVCGDESPRGKFNALMTSMRMSPGVVTDSPSMVPGTKPATKGAPRAKMTIVDVRAALRARNKTRPR